LKTNSIVRTSIVRNSIITSSLVALICASVPGFAASNCTGLENSACASNASCSWIKGYERKDGRTVKSFCRTKPGSKANAKKPSAKTKVAGPSKK